MSRLPFPVVDADAHIIEGPRGVVADVWRERSLTDAVKRRLLGDNCIAFYGL